MFKSIFAASLGREEVAELSLKKRARNDGRQKNKFWSGFREIQKFLFHEVWESRRNTEVFNFMRLGFHFVRWQFVIKVTYYIVYCMVQYSMMLYCTVLYGTAWYTIVSYRYGSVYYSMELCGTV